MTPNVLVTIILGCLCILTPKSKITCIIVFFFMWTLWAFNVWNGDYVSYMEEYYFTKWDTIEFGYRAICNFFSPWLPFTGFMMLISAIILGFFCFCGLKYTQYPGLYALFYFPIFILEFVYIRNYICLVLIFYAFLRIIFEDKSVKISIIVILLGATIHIFSICFLPIVLLIRSKFNYKSLCILILIFTFMALVASQTLIQSSSYLESKADLYARNGGNTISLTTPFHIFVVIITYWIYKHTRWSGIYYNTRHKLCMSFNVLSLVLLPVYFVLPYAASRSLRLLWVFNLFFYLSLLYSSGRKTKIYPILGLLFLVLTIGYLFSLQRFEYVLKPLYFCNLLWGYNSSYQLITY